MTTVVDTPSADAKPKKPSTAHLKVVPDTPHNFKVTTAEDLRIAEALARELR